MSLQVRVILDFTCYIHPRLALLNIELKCLTVVLDSIHNPGSDINKCYIISYTSQQ